MKKVHTPSIVGGINLSGMRLLLVLEVRDQLQRQLTTLCAVVHLSRKLLHGRHVWSERLIAQRHLLGMCRLSKQLLCKPSCCSEGPAEGIMTVLPLRPVGTLELAAVAHGAAR